MEDRQWTQDSRKELERCGVESTEGAFCLIVAVNGRHFNLVNFIF